MSAKCLPSLQPYLPSKTLSITAFIAFTFPLTSPLGAPWFNHPEKFYSELPPTTNNITQAANFATPPERIVDALWKLFHTQASMDKSIVCQHISLAGGECYPLCLVSYWREIVDQHKIQQKWQQAVTNLHQELVNNCYDFKKLNTSSQQSFSCLLSH